MTSLDAPAAELYEADVASRLAGVRVHEASDGCARASMTVAPTMLNGHGVAHGGYVFLLADTAFAFACNSAGPAEVARQCEIVYLRSAVAGDELVAEAAERVRSARGGIYDVRVTRADGEVVAELRGHSAQLKQSGAGG